jgi:Fur family transcriptional regulator, ferric uptake regulator
MDGDENMTEHDPCCRDLLTGKGMKNTKQRIAVVGELEKSGAPLTAEEIYLKIHDSCEKLSLSTVYRILDMLCKNGVVTKSGLMEGGRAMFEITPEAHRHNLICVKCHRITPLADCPLSEYESDIEKSTGYRISSHKLEVYGICPECGKNENR